MASAIAKIDDADPPISQWNGATVGGLPSTGTEVTDINIIELGDADVSAADGNSAAIGVSAEYPADFNDSVFFDLSEGVRCRVWCANKPINTLNKIFAEFDSAATVPTLFLTNPLTAGVEIPGDPTSALEGDTGIYDSAAKRVAWLLLQMQSIQTGNTAIVQSDQIHGAPIVYIETPRMDPTLTRLSPIDFSMDTEQGHMFQYSDVQLFIKNVNGDFELVAGGNNVNSIKEDTIEIETNEEHIKWEKAKPMVTFQTARTSLVTGINFKVDQGVPALEALAHQVNAEDDLTRGKVKYSVNAKSARTKEREYMVRFRSHGGFLCEVRVTRGILSKTGSATPGATEFAGKTMHIECLAANSNLETAEINYSNVPVETLFKPVNYSVTTV